MTLTSVDDYVEFCSFLRRLTGIDLSQYKRPQMERRLRAAAETGTPVCMAFDADAVARRPAISRTPLLVAPHRGQ